MDGIIKWLFRGTRESLITNLPTSPLIKSNLNKAEEFKLNGKFSKSREYEVYANSLILDALFNEGRIEEANEYTQTTAITPELQGYIDLENSYNREVDEKQLRKDEIEEAYFFDAFFLGEEGALKKKEDAKTLNRAADEESDKIINNYNNTIKRLNAEKAAAILLEQQRIKEKEAAAALKALQDSQAAIQEEADALKLKNAPIDTPMAIYMRNKIRVDTANEINESTQTIYRMDLVYLFFKSILFVILGLVFYYLMKDQSPQGIAQQLKESTKVLANTVSTTTKSIKNTVKETIKEKMKSTSKIE